MERLFRNGASSALRPKRMSSISGKPDLGRLAGALASSRLRAAAGSRRAHVGQRDAARGGIEIVPVFGRQLLLTALGFRHPRWPASRSRAHRRRGCSDPMPPASSPSDAARSRGWRPRSQRASCAAHRRHASGPRETAAATAPAACGRPSSGSGGRALQRLRRGGPEADIERLPAIASSSRSRSSGLRAGRRSPSIAAARDRTSSRR